ncbi:hypothetical protein TL16_g04508 [Triparma laevis f. inornata]|uniref:Uncharacterized protein n=1 Tax=Triparma laevis f. inornata TaxID=1714386 RepID=A0A9W7AAN5_9STRA|nr:hypothetical protein TL16_g04508 [Triparma laevis f. inornata]
MPFTKEECMVKGAESVLRPLKNKIRLECKKRRIRLNDFFTTFDRLHTKRCTKSQFYRALTISNVSLTKDEVDMLVNRYEVPADMMPDGKSDMVNYKKFCDQIDKVFAVQGLEKNPTKQVKLALEDVGEPVLGPDNPLISAVESEEVKEILGEFNKHCATRGYNVKILFGDFDRNNDGQITNEQFMRNVFVLCPNLSMAQAELVCKAYAAPMGMNYRQLDEHCNDMNLPDVEDSSLFGRIGKKTSNIQLNEDTLNEILQFFAMKFAQTPGIRIRDYFVSFDKRKSGIIRTAEFLQGVVRCFGSMTLVQTKALEVKFGDAKTGTVNWQKFIDTVTDLAGGLTYDRTPGFCKTTELADEQKTQVRDILRDMCLKVTKHRIMLKPTFQDFDRRNEDHVSREQFMRALSQFDLLPQSTYATDVLCLAFSPTSFRHSAGKFVNYRKFLDYIEAIVSITEREQMALSADAYKDVPRHLRSDFTPGEVAEPTIMLDNYGSPVNVPQVEEEQPQVDEGGEPQDSLGEFTQTFDFSSIVSSPTKFSTVHTGRPDKSVQDLIGYIRRSVLKNRVRLGVFFEDQDKLRRGKITKAQFHRGLASSGHRVSEMEVAQLAAEYSSLDEVDGDGVPFVNWKEFVADIDSVFAITGLESNPNIDVVSTLRSLRQEGEAATIFPEFSEEQNMKLASFLVEFETEVTKKCIDLFPPFEDFDRFHRGTVTANMFARVLSGLGFYPWEEVFELLAEKFKDQPIDSQKDVSYKAFIAILEMITNGADPMNVPSAMEYRNTLTADTVLPFDPTEYVERSPTKPQGFYDAKVGNVQETLEEVKRQIDFNQVRLADFLADGDRLRSGCLTTSKFRNGLARAGVQLSGTEILALEEAFKSTKRSDTVAWREFLDAVDNAAVLSKMEPEDSGVDLEELYGICDKIKEIVENRRLNLKPYFQDFDRAHFQQVTQNQFSAVMSTLMIPVSQRELSVLFTAFMVREGKKPTTRVSYKAFIRRVDVNEGE